MKSLTLKPTRQIRSLLKQIAGCGIYGVTEAEVAERFISQQIIEMLRAQPDTNFLKLRIPKPRRRRHRKQK